MITFTLCLLALIVGYFTYGRLMERVFGPDDRKTPALTKADGVDYIRCCGLKFTYCHFY